MLNSTQILYSLFLLINVNINKYIICHGPLYDSILYYPNLAKPNKFKLTSNTNSKLTNDNHMIYNIH